jgi:hypothetical protein
MIKLMKSVALGSYPTIVHSLEGSRIARVSCRQHGSKGTTMHEIVVTIMQVVPISCGPNSCAVDAHIDTSIHCHILWMVRIMDIDSSSSSSLGHNL